MTGIRIFRHGLRRLYLERKDLVMGQHLRFHIFSGIAAVSPSVWFPGFQDYALKNAIKSDAVYLSLGDREEKTRNKTMSQVGDSIRTIYHHLQGAGTDCTFEWNPGNHFKDPAGRCAKGFAWLLNR